MVGIQADFRYGLGVGLLLEASQCREEVPRDYLLEVVQVLVLVDHVGQQFVTFLLHMKAVLL